ncbi:MAG: O-antigen ligase family protein [Dethiobacteria bacterium]
MTGPGCPVITLVSLVRPVNPIGPPRQDEPDKTGKPGRPGASIRPGEHGESGSKHSEQGLEDGASTGLGLPVILHILLAAGVAVALGGLGTAAGTWDLHGAYVGGRIFTPLQYPNTGAAYLTAAYFVALGLSNRVERWYLRPVYLVPAIILFITFIFTYSRGAWLLMPPLAALFVLIVGRGSRMRMAIYLALSGIVSLLLMARIDNALRGDSPSMVWKYLLFAVCLMVAGGVLTELFLFLSWKLKAAVAGAATLLVLLVGFQLLLPVLGRPLHLERKPDEKPADKYLEQRVGDISPGDKYLLSLEVDALQEPVGGENNEPDYAWRLLVLAYNLDDERTTLLDHREGPTQGWENREFELQPGEDAERLEVRLYNHFPGTAVSARNVLLQNSRGERPLNFTLHRILPDRIYNRLYSIGAGESSVEGRLTFFRDALKIIGDYPILGAGGGGWKALYLGYQEKLYSTTEVHNHFLQVWIEAGTLGFLAFIGIWVFFIRAFLRGFFNNNTTLEKKNYWATVFVPAVALGAHSAIDFNLSLGAVSIFLFALLGAGRSLDVEEGYFASVSSGWRKKITSFGLPSWTACAAGVLAGVFILVLSISLWNGFRFGVEAERKLQENHIQEAVALFERAIDADPYQAVNYINLGRIYERLSTSEENSNAVPQLQEMALNLMRKAYELEPFNAGYNLEYAAMLLRFGHVDEGLQHAERAIELHPQKPEIFVQVARAKLAAAEHYLTIAEKDKAFEQLREVLLLEDRMTEIQGGAETLYFYLGQAAFLLGDYDSSQAYFAGMSEKNDDNYDKSLVYRAVILEHKGEDKEAETFKESFADNKELFELYGSF